MALVLSKAIVVSNTHIYTDEITNHIQMNLSVLENSIYIVASSLVDVGMNITIKNRKIFRRRLVLGGGAQWSAR